MKSIKDVLAVVVALAAAIFAIYQFYLFATFKNAQGVTDMQGGTYHLWMAIGAAVVAVIAGIVYFTGHVNQEEEIHITQ
jgi:predicted MFS family arabinose efflux permease